MNNSFSKFQNKADPANPVNVTYTIKPAPLKINARFVGKEARCGNCNHLLGIFNKAQGEIMCKRVHKSSHCNTLNILVK